MSGYSLSIGSGRHKDQYKVVRRDGATMYYDMSEVSRKLIKHGIQFLYDISVPSLWLIKRCKPAEVETCERQGGFLFIDRKNVSL